MIISSYLLNGLIHLAILSPFIWLAKPLLKQTGNGKSMLLFYATYLLYAILGGGLAGIFLFEGQQWNWVGKTAVLLVIAIAIFKHKGLTSDETGIKLYIKKGSLLPVTMLVALGLSFRIAVYFIVQKPEWHLSVETIAFQGGLNALCDELVFRGVILALLNKLYTYSEDIAGFKITTAALFTSMLYALAYGFILHPDMRLEINLIRILLAFFAGLIAAMLKEKSGSLWPAFLFMSIWALIGNHF